MVVKVTCVLQVLCGSSNISNFKDRNVGHRAECVSGRQVMVVVLEGGTGACSTFT